MTARLNPVARVELVARTRLAREDLAKRANERKRRVPSATRDPTT
jgi:hypothetical protein